jgi:hypothetical protein
LAQVVEVGLGRLGMEGLDLVTIRMTICCHV